MGRRERNKEDKQRRLEAAGLAAFLEQGFTGASVERIAESADVARGTFYLYFRDKEALFASLLDRLFVPLLSSVARARDALAACPDTPSTFPVYGLLGAELAGLMIEQEGALRLYFAEARAVGAGGEAVRDRMREVHALTVSILDDAVARGVLRDHETRTAAVAIVGGIDALVYAFLRDSAAARGAGGTSTWSSGVDPVLAQSEVIALFRHGLAPRP